MEELGKDYAYASRAEAEVFCPTCGTVHDNDFTHKFSILDDREACAQFLRDQYDRLVDIRKRAHKVEARLNDTDVLIEKVAGTLAEKEGDLTLKEVIENASANMARGLFDTQLDDIRAEVDRRAGEIVEIDAEVKKLDDKKRRKEIEAYYAELMTGFLRTLNVRRIDLDSAIRIVRKVNDTGSDQPRAVLAYHLALMKTIFRFSSALTAPMIIDSPNQQDQDATNVAAMIALILSSRPDNGQTILGTVSLHDQKVEDGEVIELVDELSALSPDQYPQILDTMNPFLGML
jgi:hypothetical protein